MYFKALSETKNKMKDTSYTYDAPFRVRVYVWANHSHLQKSTLQWWNSACFSIDDVYMNKQMSADKCIGLFDIS